jgi:hypothetical protein
VQRNLGWGEDPAQATAMPVAPPEPGWALRVAPVAGLHSSERNPRARAGRPSAAPPTRECERGEVPGKTRAVKSAPVVALAGSDRYGLPL